MLLFVLSTLEKFSNCNSEKDEKCFLSKVSEFLFLNEFEEMAVSYKVISVLDCMCYKNFIKAEMKEILKKKKYPPMSYRRLKAFGL